MTLNSEDYRDLAECSPQPFITRRRVVIRDYDEDDNFRKLILSDLQQQCIMMENYDYES